jgi:AraC-like DNA-binding protein
VTTEKIHRISVSPEFQFYVHYPEGMLADFIAAIWASGGIPPFSQERIVPDGSNVLLFNFGDPVAIDDRRVFRSTLFAGVNSQYDILKYEPGRTRHTQAGVIFKPGSAYPFIRQPLLAFKNATVETSAFDDRYFDAVYEQLGELQDPCERISRLAQVLSERLKKKFEDHLTPGLINLIRKHPEKSIEDIAQKTGYSRHHVNRLLGKFAGTNAKGLQKIFRLSLAMQAVQNIGSQRNLTEITYELGYFDQAHFIHEFKAMTGMTPREYQLLRPPDPNRVIYL